MVSLFLGEKRNRVPIFEMYFFEKVHIIFENHSKIGGTP